MARSNNIGPKRRPGESRTAFLERVRKEARAEELRKAAAHKAERKMHQPGRVEHEQALRAEEKATYHPKASDIPEAEANAAKLARERARTQIDKSSRTRSAADLEREISRDLADSEQAATVVEARRRAPGVRALGERTWDQAAETLEEADRQGEAAVAKLQGEKAKTAAKELDDLVGYGNTRERLGAGPETVMKRVATGRDPGLPVSLEQVNALKAPKGATARIWEDWVPDAINPAKRATYPKNLSQSLAYELHTGHPPDFGPAKSGNMPERSRRFHRAVMEEAKLRQRTSGIDPFDSVNQMAAEEGWDDWRRITRLPDVEAAAPSSPLPPPASPLPPPATPGGTTLPPPATSPLPPPALPEPALPPPALPAPAAELPPPALPAPASDLGTPMAAEPIITKTAKGKFKVTYNGKSTYHMTEAQAQAKVAKLTPQASPLPPPPRGQMVDLPEGPRLPTNKYGNPTQKLGNITGAGETFTWPEKPNILRGGLQGDYTLGGRYTPGSLQGLGDALGLPPPAATGGGLPPPRLPPPAPPKSALPPPAPGPRGFGPFGNAPAGNVLQDLGFEAQPRYGPHLSEVTRPPLRFGSRPGADVVADLGLGAPRLPGRGPLALGAGPEPVFGPHLSEVGTAPTHAGRLFDPSPIPRAAGASVGDEILGLGTNTPSVRQLANNMPDFTKATPRAFQNPLPGIGTGLPEPRPFGPQLSEVQPLRGPIPGTSSFSTPSFGRPAALPAPAAEGINALGGVGSVPYGPALPEVEAAAPGILSRLVGRAGFPGAAEKLAMGGGGMARGLAAGAVGMGVGYGANALADRLLTAENAGTTKQDVGQFAQGVGSVAPYASMLGMLGPEGALAGGAITLGAGALNALFASDRTEIDDLRDSLHAQRADADVTQQAIDLYSARVNSGMDRKAALAEVQGLATQSILAAQQEKAATAATATAPSYTVTPEQVMALQQMHLNDLEKSQQSYEHWAGLSNNALKEATAGMGPAVAAQYGYGDAERNRAMMEYFAAQRGAVMYQPIKESIEEKLAFQDQIAQRIKQMQINSAFPEQQTQGSTPDLATMAVLQGLQQQPAA